jgi:hypothetical protein
MTACSLLTSNPPLLTASQPYMVLTMPPHFKIQFDVAFSTQGMLPEVRNFLKVVSTTGRQLLAVDMLRSNKLRVTYDGMVMTSFGLSLVASDTSAFTTVTVGYAYGTVFTTTAGIGSTGTSDATSTFFDTSGLTFNLLLSESSDFAGYGSGGDSIRNVIITGKNPATPEGFMQRTLIVASFLFCSNITVWSCVATHRRWLLVYSVADQRPVRRTHFKLTKPTGRATRTFSGLNRPSGPSKKSRKRRGPRLTDRSHRNRSSIERSHG